MPAADQFDPAANFPDTSQATAANQPAIQQAPPASNSPCLFPWVSLPFLPLFFQLYRHDGTGGLSGDLRDPGKSIPLGTLAGTITGMIIYFSLPTKLAVSASPADLADTSRLVILISPGRAGGSSQSGLLPTISYLGSIMVAPRTPHTIARDHIFPTPTINRWIAQGKGASDEPFNASIVTLIIAGFSF